MLTKNEREIIGMKTRQIFALILANNLDGALRQTENVAADLVQIRNKQIKEKERKNI